MPAELQERRRDVLSKVKGLVSKVTELSDGFACQFPSDGTVLPELANLIQLERQCCPFLSFRLTVEANHGAVLLEMTGPAGTKEFLADIFR
jgi:hypothetical protein